ncbi:MAG: META domain-containing protein [Muribaculaceae bacterium]|nr:META domain-containing protein [Muribaculaceae bacterium]
MNKLLISIFGLSAMLLTSCSVFKNETTVVSAGSQTTQTTQPKSTNKTSASKKNTKRTKKSSSKPLMPQVAAGQEEKQHYAVEISDKTLNGEWTVAEVNGAKVTGEENRPYINFSVAEKRFYGSNGCNILNGDFIVNGNNLTFENVIATQKACYEAPFEYEINYTIGQVKSYMVDRIGNEYYLSLFDDNKVQTMVLRKHNMDYLNGAWQVMTIDNESCDGEGVQMVIDIPELKLHGNTGCNIVNGQLLIDPDKENSIQFHQLISTLKACPNQSVETSFLVALEKVESAKKGEGDTVLMYDKNGIVVLVLKRIQQ